MKHLLTILAVAMTAVVMQVAGAADVSWTGTGGVVDWNATTWSTGTPPGATDTVTFTPDRTFADFTVTPPADFKGKIVIANRSGYNLAGSYFQGRIKIVNSNNAVFSIGGAGSIEAFDGIESMIDAAYAGDIEIPAGVSFAPPESFPSGASFVGIGTFTPATPAQLEAAQRFRGRIDLSEVGELVVRRDHTIFMGRDLVLGSGVSVDDSGAEIVISKIDNLSAASGWTLNGNNSELLPTFDANGKLKFPGAKSTTHSAYFNRRFKKDETFLIKFKWCRLAVVGSTLGLETALGIRVGELTDYPTTTAATTVGALPEHTYGIGSHVYNANKYLFRLYDQAKYPSTGSWQNHIIASSCGFDFAVGTKYDVTVFCNKGILTISLVGDGASRTWTTDVSKAFADDPRGVMFGFSDLSDGSDAQTMEFWDFKGWVASEDNGQWKADPQFAFGAENYHLYLDYNESDGVKSFRGADALDAQGRLRICEGINWYGAAISKTTVPNDKRFRINWTLDVGSTTGQGEGTEIGLLNITDENIKAKFGDYDVADGSGYGTDSRKYLNTGDPIKFCHAWYQNLFGMTRTWQAGTQAARYTGTYENTAVFKTANSTNVGKMHFDGVSAYETRVVNSSDGVVHTFTLTTTPNGTRRLAVVGYGSGSRYTQDWMRDISLSYWNESYVATPYVNVSAPAGVMTTMPGTGKYAPIAVITLEDDTSRLSLTGNVAFGETLTVVVPEDFVKTTRTKAVLIDWTAATLVSTIPTSVNLVDEAGAAISLRGRTLTATAEGIELSAPLGLFIVVQ